MRELTKSMFRFTWAMPLFGLRQMTNLAMPADPRRPTAKAAEAFDSLSAVAQDQLGGTLRSAFDAGDSLQRGMVDVMFSIVGMGALRPAREAASKTMEAVRPATATAPGTGPAGAHDRSPGYGTAADQHLASARLRALGACASGPCRRPARVHGGLGYRREARCRRFRPGARRRSGTGKGLGTCPRRSLMFSIPSKTRELNLE